MNYSVPTKGGLCLPLCTRNRPLQSYFVLFQPKVDVLGMKGAPLHFFLHPNHILFITEGKQNIKS